MDNWNQNPNASLAAAVAPGTPTQLAALPAPRQIRTPMAGVAEMAQALINGYGQQNQSPNGVGAPMTLASAQPNPGVLNALINGPYGAPTTTDRPTGSVDPSTYGVY